MQNGESQGLDLQELWLEQSGKESIIVEIPDQWAKIRDYLLENGWKKQYTWLELVRWLDERTRQEIIKM